MAPLGRGTENQKAELTLPTAPQLMRLKHRENKLSHGPDANCSIKFSLPVLRSYTT